MGTILIDTLLSHCVERGASELCLEVGLQAAVRVGDRTQHLGLVPGSLERCRIGETITPPERLHELQERGETRFDFGFGDSAKVRTLISRRNGAPVIELQLS